MTRPDNFKAENETAWQKKVIEEKKEGRQHTIEELISKGQHFFQAEDFGSALEVYTHGIEKVSKVRQTFIENIILDWQRSILSFLQKKTYQDFINHRQSLARLAIAWSFHDGIVHS